MAYLNRKTIAQHQHADGVHIAVIEGLNDRSDYEVELTIPKDQWAEFDAQPALYDKHAMHKRKLYFGVNPKGVVRFYAYSQPGNGFGGARVTINTVDGEETLIGPWSSRCGVMNHAFQASMEIVLITQYRFASAMTFSALNKYLQPCGFTCDMRKRDGDWTPYITPLFEGALA